MFAHRKGPALTEDYDDSPYRYYATQGEARRWIMRMDETPHGFDFACRALGQDPAVVRVILLTAHVDPFLTAAMNERGVLVRDLGYGRVAKALRARASHE